MKDNSSNGAGVALASVVAILVWGAGAYLLFYVPVLGERLADAGAELSGGMQLLLDSSDFLRRYALFLSPIFLVLAGLPFYLACTGGKDD